MSNRPVDHVLIDFEGQTSNADVPHKTLLLQLLKGWQSLLDYLHSPPIVSQSMVPDNAGPQNNAIKA